MGKSVDEEIKEKAFQLWRKNGRSPEKTAKALSDLGHAVSRQSIDAWKNERNWDDRAAKADAIEQQAKDPNLSGEEKMIAALASQISRYETYFETLTPKEIDTQAVYAYTNLITTITNIRKKLDEKPDLFRMTPIVMEEFVAFVKKNVKEQTSQDLVFGMIDRFFDEVKPE